jgi:8-oxo-dGTP pyrophosphatase MutT (NUDIX family)
MVLIVSDGNPPYPAATVIIVRDSADGPETFMVRRHDRSPFMARAHVFPGGRVDAGDHASVDPEWCDGVMHTRKGLEGLTAEQAAAHFVAAARELFEEAGVLLARRADGAFVSLDSHEDQVRFTGYRHEVHSGQLPMRAIVERERLRLALDALLPCAHWVTPPVDTRRFDTRFFIARMPPGQTPAHDDTETTHGEWITAAGAIRAAERRDIILPPPTWVTLSELAAFSSVDDLVRGVAARPIPRREPGQDQRDGRRVLVMQSYDSSEPRRFIWTDDRWLPQELTVGGRSGR